MSKQLVTFTNIHKIAVPAIIGGLAEPVLSSTDAAIIGKMDINATEALAAVGIVGAFLSTLIWIVGQTRSVISSIISQYVGANKVSFVNTLPTQAISFNVLISVFLLVVTYFFAVPIFEFLGAQHLVLSYSLDYYNIRIWGFPFTLIVFAIFGIFRGFQNTYWPMIVATIGALLNIVLDIVLVYGIEDFIPPMHIKGAAYASVISQVVMAVLAFYWMLSKTNVKLYFGKHIHHDIGRLVKMSLNLFLRAVSLNVALLTAVKTAAHIGDAEVAAHAIAVNIWLFTAFFIDGYASAGNIYGGRLLGAKDFDQLHRLIKKVCLYGLILGGVLMLLGVLFYKPIGLIFTNESEVLNVLYSFFFIVILVQPLNAIAFVLDGVFKGFGEMEFLRNLLFLATFAGFLPVLYITQKMGLGIQGIWIAMTLWLSVRSLGMFRKLFVDYKLRL